MTEKIYMIPNPPTPSKGVKFDPQVCVGCNSCVEICPTDVLMPNPEKGKPPIVLYAEECWFCGTCVEECPTGGAIKLVFPLNQQISVNWKRKESGEYFRLGMLNPPRPNTRPVSGGQL